MTNPYGADKPCGAYVEVKYSTGEVRTEYVSFGTYDPENECSAPEGRDDREIFIYCSQKELVNMLGKKYEAWTIRSIIEYVYVDVVIEYDCECDECESDYGHGEVCDDCMPELNAPFMGKDMVEYFVREQLQELHDDNIRRHLLLDLLSDIESIIPKDESVGCPHCKKMMLQVIQFVGSRIKKGA